MVSTGRLSSMRLFMYLQLIGDGIFVQSYTLLGVVLSGAHSEEVLSSSSCIMSVTADPQNSIGASRAKAVGAALTAQSEPVE